MIKISNAQLKLAQKLKQKKYRSELGLFVAEGLRLCEMVTDFNKIEFGFFTPEILSDERAKNLIARLREKTQMNEIPSVVFRKISDTQTPQGILLVVRQKIFSLEEATKKNLIVALDGVQDPGNVGTISRTVEAFGGSLILLEGSADIFNPKVVRSSMGAIFNLPIVEMSRKNFLSSIKFCGAKIVAAALDSSAEIYFKHDFTKKTVVVFGNEGSGVSQEILKESKKIFIPMSGMAESLNVATSAAIIISEFVRQNL